MKNKQTVKSVNEMLEEDKESNQKKICFVS